jgi:hypothetical protein
MKGREHMATEYTVRVHFIDETERIVPAINIQEVGEEGARRATALVDGREVPIYSRVEWGFLWYEQEPTNEAARYNREIDERNRINVENREKPWLPFSDGE